MAEQQLVPYSPIEQAVVKLPLKEEAPMQMNLQSESSQRLKPIEWQPKEEYSDQVAYPDPGRTEGRKSSARMS